jgi:hypothetical protein
VTQGRPCAAVRAKVLIHTMKLTSCLPLSLAWYFSFLAAVDAEAKAGQGQNIGGMAAPSVLQRPADLPVPTALGEMSAPIERETSGSHAK